jgi:prepilin-type N-terminal cleavage/methylation domain-containing protein
MSDTSRPAAISIMLHRLPLFTQRAFTLVDLLVVIVIIAILSDILIPTVSRTRSSAQNVKCTSNLRQLGTVFHLHATDHNGQLTHHITSRHEGSL